MKKITLSFLLAIASIGAFAQKTTQGNCRFHVDATYTHGLYQVVITNYTQECTTYSIVFPDGYMLRETRTIFGGAKDWYNHVSSIPHGVVIVTALNRAPATYPFEPAIVNL